MLVEELGLMNEAYGAGSGHSPFPLLVVGASERAKRDKMGCYSSLYRMAQGEVVTSKDQEAETS